MATQNNDRGNRDSLDYSENPKGRHVMVEHDNSGGKTDAKSSNQKTPTPPPLPSKKS